MYGREDVGFGCTRFHQACELRNIPAPTRIVHSPFVRTTQTAQIIASAFNHTPVITENALRPGGDTAAVDSVLLPLDSENDDQHIVLVSHQPLVSYLVDHYLGDISAVPSLPPGGFVTLSLDVPATGCGTPLFWAFPPEYEAGL